MTSKKLRKYLAYYQKTLREEPENIEARLRLAAVFRDMGREVHAIEEYGTASRLLAREGLALEAIAACKAILELAPDHTDTQLFLARMYARVPDAAGGVARIARPLKTPAAQGADDWTPARRGTPTTTGASQPFELGPPKQRGEGLSARSQSQPTAQRQEEVTVVGQMDPGYEKFIAAQRAAIPTSEPTLHAIPLIERDDEDVRSTQELEPANREAAMRGSAKTSAPSSAQGPRRDDLGSEQGARPEELVGTSDITAEREVRTDPAELRRTQDIDASDILLEEVVSDRVDALRGTQDVDADDIIWAAEEPADQDPITDEFALKNEEGLETFEAGVFDMKSLRLDAPQSGQWDELAFLDELDVLDGLDESNTAELHSLIDTGDPAPVLSVKRADLPHIPLFSDLDASTFLQLLEWMEYREIAPDTYIIEPGRTEPALYIIVRGAIVVERQVGQAQVELARMGEGEFFGEFALLTGRSELASVRSQGKLAVLEVSRDVLVRIAEKDPKIWDVLWDFYYARVLNNLLAASRIFRSLSDAARQRLIGHFTLRELEAGEMLAEQGAEDDSIYMICMGQVQVEMGREAGSPRVIDTLGEGDFIGLISGASKQPVVADLRALCETSLLALPGDEFRRAAASSEQIAHEVNEAVKIRKQKAAAGSDALSDRDVFD